MKEDDIEEKILEKLEALPEDTEYPYAIKLSELMGDTKQTPKLRYKCTICLRHKSSKNFPIFPCNHKVCKTCLRTYIYLEVKSGRTDIKCPSIGFSDKPCEWYLGRSAVAKLCDNDKMLLEKWDRFEKQNALAKLSGVVFCPMPDCDWAVVCPTSMKKCPKIVCGKCEQAFCYKCRGPWDSFHVGNKCFNVAREDNAGFYGKLTGTRMKKNDSNIAVPCPKCKYSTKF